MIRINYNRDDGRHFLTVTGHAGYAEYGQDIVCAGVSAVSFALLGFLEQEGVRLETAEAGSGALDVACMGSVRTDTAFDMALAGYRLIADNYPDCVDLTIDAGVAG